MIYGEIQWIRLAHVCRRWRDVVFQSPRRLNLRLVCTPERPVGNILEIWPSFPLIIYGDYAIYSRPPSNDNTITALEHNDRVCRISLISLPVSKLEDIANSAAMQKPFPKLTNFLFHTFMDDHGRLPDSILGGNAPRLRSLILTGVTFLGLSKLLLSTTHLVDLHLHNIPHSGYIPPEAMATSLSALTSLEHLSLRFQSPRPRPALESRRPLSRPLTRSILPSLTDIRFKGASEYLEEILARIDTPRLNELQITFFNQIIFDTPQLFQLISRTPTLRSLETGLIEFDSEATTITFLSQTSPYDVQLTVEISCRTSEWQLSSLEQVCTKSLPPASTLEDLYIHEFSYFQQDWQDDVENTLWLELLHPFTAVKNLYLPKTHVPRIAPALQELVGGRTTEVLPILERIFLEGFQPSGPLNEGIEKFVTARALTRHPVVVSHWDRYPEQ